MKRSGQTFSGFAGEKQAHNDINISLYRHRCDVPLSVNARLAGIIARNQQTHTPHSRRMKHARVSIERAGAPSRRAAYERSGSTPLLSCRRSRCSWVGLT